MKHIISFCANRYSCKLCVVQRMYGRASQVKCHDVCRQLVIDSRYRLASHSTVGAYRAVECVRLFLMLLQRMLATFSSTRPWLACYCNATMLQHIKCDPSADAKDGAAACVLLDFLIAMSMVELGQVRLPFTSALCATRPCLCQLFCTTNL